MSAKPAISVSDSLLATLRRPSKQPEREAAYLRGEYDSLPARRLPYAQHLPKPVAEPRSRRAPRSADQEKRVRRRRLLAATWPMPPVMACQLTTCEQAFARIVADEVRHHGKCEVDLYQIARRAGMCRKTAQRAQKHLAALGWIAVQHRPIKGRKHLPNVITITSGEWAAWIEHGPKPRERSIGGHSHPIIENQSISNKASPLPPDQKWALERQERRRRRPPPRFGGTHGR